MGDTLGKRWIIGYRSLQLRVVGVELGLWGNTHTIVVDSRMAARASGGVRQGGFPVVWHRGSSGVLGATLGVILVCGFTDGAIVSLMIQHNIG